MEIYFDGNCRLCIQTIFFLQNNLNTKTNVHNIQFINIWRSKYVEFSTQTIVVVINDKEYFYGEALRKIISIMKYPYRFGIFLPVFDLNIIYKLMKLYRKFK